MFGPSNAVVTAWMLYPKMVKLFLYVLYLYEAKLAQVMNSPFIRVSLYVLVETGQLPFA